MTASTMRRMVAGATSKRETDHAMPGAPISRSPITDATSSSARAFDRVTIRAPDSRYTSYPRTRTLIAAAGPSAPGRRAGLHGKHGEQAEAGGEGRDLESPAPGLPRLARLRAREEGEEEREGKEPSIAQAEELDDG